MSSATRDPARRTRVHVTISSAFVAALAVVAVCTVVDGNAWLAQMQAAAPSVGLLAGVLALVSAVRRRLVVAGAAMLASVVMVAPVVSIPASERVGGSRTLSVMVANTYVGALDPSALVAEIERRRVDVLVMPEMTEAFWTAAVAAGLTRLLPHTTGRSGDGSGMVVATREPVTCLEIPSGVQCGHVGADTRAARGDVPLDRRGRPTFDNLVVALPDGTVVRGVHQWSPRLSPTVRWRENQGELAEWIAQQPRDRPLVLAGDFNAGLSHPVFRSYAAGFDHSPSGGFPWTRTWPRWGVIPPFTQLDHVLAHGWRTQTSEVIDLPGSDHRAAWTLLTR